MNNQDLLIESLKLQKPISFEYIKPGKPPGKRMGNVHAVFHFTTKAGVKSLKTHIVQTDGVSDSKQIKPLPDLRMFDVKDLDNIVILKDHPIFKPFYDLYRPDWEGYKDAIALI